MLADVTLRDHGPVKALFHHDKNGFFYALDRSGAGAGASLFRNRLPLAQFLATVSGGRPGTNMPAFEQLLSADEIRQVHAFLMSRDAL